MEKFETKKLYVVKPSIVTYDNSKFLRETIDGGLYLHTVDFKTNTKDIDVAIPISDNYYYKSIFDNKHYYKGITSHLIEGDYYVGINNDDIVLLSKYLYENKVSNPKWDNELNEYICSLKPYYSYEEIVEILNSLKTNIIEKETIKTYEKKFKIW